MIPWYAQHERLTSPLDSSTLRFVKNMGKDTALCPNGMDVAKLTHKKVLQTLENGVRFGKWILLENIGEVRTVGYDSDDDDTLSTRLTGRACQYVFTAPSKAVAGERITGDQSE